MPHLYLCLTPESLIASMLEPADFGRYLAISPNRNTSGPAIFFELDPARALPEFDGGQELFDSCAPHADGKPRRSTYLAIYRVLERAPLSAFRSLFLTTKDGLVLELKASETREPSSDDFFLYQELAPVTPRVVSRLKPSEFGEFITKQDQALSVPKIVFADLKLGPLATDPGSPSNHNLPYRRLEHLRDCLQSLQQTEGKPAKVLNRDFQIDDLYFNLKSGFYLSGNGSTLFFEMPEEEVLSAEHNAWRKSARATGVL